MTNLANLPAATSLIDIHGSKSTAATSRKLMAASEALNGPALPAALGHLIDLHVSRLNGCSYCKLLHLAEARETGVDEALIAQMGDPAAVAALEDRRLAAALAWAEALTLPCDEAALDAPRAELARHWSPEEQAAITVKIALINAWNRLGRGAWHVTEAA
ncbi:carboxymuconolactone decarboxylase family protein [Tistrella mobilis]|jgi:AhpD family alkylhydroperoxidase|uniref:carboxymuconolactone decarboxylase family protein n=1 Tax=Tistrella mobilis TaxID=171437 RepID=UPI0035582B9E